MSQSAALLKKNRSHGYVPWMVFGVTVLSSLVGWQVADKLAQQRDQRRFAEVCVELQNRIVDNLTAKLWLGNSTAAFMGSNPAASRKDFNGFLARQGWPSSVPDLGTISYMVHVPAGGGREFEQFAKAHGVHVKVDFSRDTRDRILNLYRMPEEKGMRPAGADVTQIEDRRLALESAADTGQPTATQPTILVQDRGHNPRPSIIIFIPIFSSPEKPIGIRARRHGLSGFVAVGVRMATVMKELVATYRDEPALALYFGDTPSAATFLYSNLTEKSYRESIRRHVSLFGRPMYFDFYSTPAFDEANGLNPAGLILAGGFAFALILFYLTNNQLKTQTELAGFAEEIERRAAAESLLARAGTLFSNFDDYRSVLEKIGKAAVPSLADLCSIDVLEGEEIREILLYSVDKEELESARAMSTAYPISLQDKIGIGQVLRTGESELIPDILNELVHRTDLDAGFAEYIRERKFSSAMFVPIRVRSQILGVMTFVTRQDKRPYNAVDLRLVEEVAERIGLAIDNARLFQSAQSELAEKVKAESALKSLNEELEHLVTGRTRELSIAVDELEAFCYSVSHDLRAPLRSVDGFSKALIEDYRGQIDSDGVDYLNRIRGAAKRMDELITAMLTLSRLTRAEITPIPVSVSEVANEICREHHEFGKFTCNVQPKMKTSADPNMLRILLENLITNAVKFSGRSSDPTITIGQMEDETFFVSDNGVGFDPRYSNKLFQPFERLHTPAEFPGSGIGLATVSRVVKRHGGQIWAESEVGKGATFFFTLSPDKI